MSEHKASCKAAITTFFHHHGGKKAQHAFDPKFDGGWDAAWHQADLTNGSPGFSLAKPFFPKGRMVLEFVNLISRMGWTPAGVVPYLRDDEDGVPMSWTV